MLSHYYHSFYSNYSPICQEYPSLSHEQQKKESSNVSPYDLFERSSPSPIERVDSTSSISQAQHSDDSRLSASITSLYQEIFHPPEHLRDCSSSDREKEEVVLRFVEKDGRELQSASPSLKANRKIVKAAVENYGLALIYADPSLQNNEEIVLAAVMQDGNALMAASPELKKNKSIIKAAIENAPEAIQWIDRELQYDLDFIGELATINQMVIRYTDILPL